MKKTFVLLAAAALALTARTAPVTVSEARQSAQAWASRGAVLGARLGASVERASALSLSSGEKAYAVKMAGGGTVFVAADDDLGPVVAFTAATNDFSTVDERSPLWALLNRDAALRAFVRTNAAAQASLRAAKAAAASSAKADSTSSTPLTSEPSDLRVAPLVKSQWYQETADGKLCQNRYTPVLKTGKHALCGCVATAMAQIMRYHRFPTASVAPVTRTCYVNIYAATTVKDPNCVTNLTTQGGVYDWDSMPLVPDAGATDAQCEAIGKLTSDAGISAYMSYGTDDFGSSSTFDHLAAKALTEVFGYADADYHAAEEISSSSTAMQQGLFANFDAGLPVLMGISGDGGHAIVGDGYGYENGKLYVHLNMGWAGQGDYWYNLPNIAADDFHFTIFDDMVFNIIPTDADAALLTGRVTDEATNAVASAAVRLYAAGTTTLVSSGETSDTGVYAFRVPAGTYDVVVAKPGFSTETLSSVKVAKTQTQSKTRTFNRGAGWSATYSDIPVVASFGNSYGNDVTVHEPRARIVSGGVESAYATLDTAIAAAKELADAGAASVTIELLGEIPLSATAEIDFPCAIRASGAAADASVVRASGAALAVKAGGVLALSDVSFASVFSTAVTVEAGGRLELGGGVDFNVPSALAAVRTADADGFVMTDALGSGFSLLCAAADDAGEAFGRATCAAATAEASAPLIASAADATGSIRGAATANPSGEIYLKWEAGSPVPLSEAAAYFVDLSGKTNAAARLDDALNLFQAQQATGEVGDSGEIVVRERADLSLTRLTTVTGSLTIRGETADVTVSDFEDGDGGFVVGDGASLTVSGIAFDGYRGNALFLVDGGSLTLESATVIGANGTNYHSGAVAVLSGSARLVGCALAGCEASGEYAARSCASSGGGVYLKGAGASLALEDSSVEDCAAKSYGGGVYAGAGASVTLSGAVTVRGNSSGNISAGEDNLHLCAGKASDASLALSGVVTGEVGVRWRALSVVSPRSLAGGVFATGAASVVYPSVRAFSNDADATLVAEASGASLVWAEADSGSKEVDESEALVRVLPTSGATRYYAGFSDAVAELSGDATVELLGDDTLLDPAEIAYAVTLRSASGSTFTLSRYQGTNSIHVAKGASLTLSDVVLDGRGKSGAIFLDVEGGSLTLKSGATVRDAAGRTQKAASAIRVAQEGTFVMESGSLVTGCYNLYTKSASELGVGGGVCIDRSTAYLRGGTITDCASWVGGGVIVCNKGVAYVSGDLNVTENHEVEEFHSDPETHELVVTTDLASNLLVSDNSALYLENPLTGDVGCLAGILAPTNVFGRVAEGFSSGSDAEEAASAHRFVNDDTGDVGIAVRPSSGSGASLLVWSDALDVDGEVAVDGTNYVMVAGGETLTAAVEGSTVNFVYTGAEQAPTFEGHGFAVVAEPQTDAGSYTATLTPKFGFAWSDDGTKTTRTVTWTIAKAVYDMGGVAFESKTFAYDGEPHSLEVSGTLPDGVTVAYDGNGQTEVGVYTVTAEFSGDAANYEPISSMTATLTISDATPGPGPEPTVVTNVPTPIAFQSIERIAEGSWRLVVTNRVPWCWYRLLSTDDLTKGFSTTNEWEQAPSDATPAWTNDVEATVEARFWRAEAKEGIVE